MLEAWNMSAEKRSPAFKGSRTFLASMKSSLELSDSLELESDLSPRLEFSSLVGTLVLLVVIIQCIGKWKEGGAIGSYGCFLSVFRCLTTGGSTSKVSPYALPLLDEEQLVVAREGANQISVMANLGSTDVSSLQIAASSGDSTTIRSLLAARVLPGLARDDGLVPLHFAVQGGHIDAALVLLAGGSPKDPTGPGGFTPLHDAAHAGRLAMAKALLAAGASPNPVASCGTTPLHSAARCGHADVVELLLSHGARHNATSDGGFQPLHDAAHEGHVHVAQLLLEAGAKLAKSADGGTPLHFALRARHTDIVALIRHHVGTRRGFRDEMRLGNHQLEDRRPQRQHDFHDRCGTVSGCCQLRQLPQSRSLVLET